MVTAATRSEAGRTTAVPRDHLAGAIALAGSARGALERAGRGIVDAAQRLGVELTRELARVDRPIELFEPAPCRELEVAAGGTAAGSIALAWLVTACTGAPCTVDRAHSLAALWSAHGSTAFDRIDGAYAAVLVERGGAVVAAVAPGGDAKLYYRIGDGVLAWSTHPLLVLGDAVTCDAEYFRHAYLALFTGDRTPFRGVRRVPPGHWVRIEPPHGATTTRRWWWPPVGTLVHRCEDDYAHQLRGELRGAVARTVRGHRRIAVALSAGIDSTSVAACAADLVRSGDLEDVVAITIATDEPISDEAPLARQAASVLGVRHRTITARFPTALDDLCARAAVIGFPSTHVLLAGLHEQLARGGLDAGATLVLDGAGGEVLMSDLGDLWAFTCAAPWSAALAVAGVSRHVPARVLLRSLVARIRDRGRHLDPRVALARRPWLRPSELARLELEEMPATLRNADLLVVGDPDVHETTGRAYIAPTGMPWRSPYLDRRVLELAYSLPFWIRLPRTADLAPKTLARRAFPEVSPELARRAGRLRSNSAYARAWLGIAGVAQIRDLIARLPSSLDPVLDRDRAASCASWMSDLDRFGDVLELAATAVWAEGLRRRGWSVA